MVERDHNLECERYKGARLYSFTGPDSAAFALCNLMASAVAAVHDRGRGSVWPHPLSCLRTSP